MIGNRFIQQVFVDWRQETSCFASTADLTTRPEIAAALPSLTPSHPYIEMLNRVFDRGNRDKDKAVAQPRMKEQSLVSGHISLACARSYLAQLRRATKSVSSLGVSNLSSAILASRFCLSLICATIRHLKLRSPRIRSRPSGLPTKMRIVRLSSFLDSM